MRVETISRKIYNIDDLRNNKELLDRVLSKWVFNPVWVDEWHESLAGFKSSLPYPPENEGMTGLRLRTWIINNYYPLIESRKYLWNQNRYRYSRIQVEISCPFTGYYGDMDCLGPILDFVKNPNSCDVWQDIICVCENAWELAFAADMEYQQSEEYILNLIEANGYEFTEDGELI